MQKPYEIVLDLCRMAGAKHGCDQEIVDDAVNRVIDFGAWWHGYSGGTPIDNQALTVDVYDAWGLPEELIV